MKNWIRKHKILSVLAAIILVCIIAAAAGGNKATPPASSDSQAGASNASSGTLPKIGRPARDGKFEFTVSSFKCGQTQIIQSDDQYEVAKAQGKFCIMHLKVRNIGTVAQTFDDDAQYIYDSGNSQYSDDSEGTIAANPSSSQFMLDPNVNPGVSISGVLAFDIPKNVTPVSATLHDSSLSNGVKVSLK